MKTLLLLSALLCQDKPFPEGDPRPAIEAAKKKAAAENRRVLILAGANNSETCRAAAQALKKDKQVAKLILYEYDVVLYQVKFEPGADGDRLEPWMILMDAEGKELSASQPPVESKALIELLKKHQAPPWKAQDVLDAAKKKAAAEKKRVLLTFGAPW